MTFEQHNKVEWEKTVVTIISQTGTSLSSHFYRNCVWLVREYFQFFTCCDFCTDIKLYKIILALFMSVKVHPFHFVSQAICHLNQLRP